MISFIDGREYNLIENMEPMKKMVGMGAKKVDLAVDADKASFLDVFSGMVKNVVDTNAQVDSDILDLMAGNIDNIAEVQANMAKAGIAVDLLVTVKNEVISAYNSIINMQI